MYMKIKGSDFKLYVKYVSIGSKLGWSLKIAYPSLERAKYWVTEVQKNEERCHIYLCGTKLDLVLEEPQVRQLDYHDVVDYADQVGILLYL